MLKDLMESGAFATVILNKIFRQAGESDIVVNAHLINEGKQISLNNHSENKQQKHPPQNPPIDGPVTAGHTDVL